MIAIARAALARVAIPLGAAVLLAAAPYRTPTPPRLPPTIHACETNTATLCADWRLEGDTYVADWEQGSHAVIRAVVFGAKDVVFIRDDPSGTSAGMHAVYVGHVTGRTVAFERGIVVWTQNGQSFPGRWTAEW